MLSLPLILNPWRLQSGNRKLVSINCFGQWTFYLFLFLFGIPLLRLYSLMRGNDDTIWSKQTFNTHPRYRWTFSCCLNFRILTGTTPTYPLPDWGHYRCLCHGKRRRWSSLTDSTNGYTLLLETLTLKKIILNNVMNLQTRQKYVKTLLRYQINKLYFTVDDSR